jgi:hypothetical protein
LGLELGSEKMKIRLPEDKMVKLKDKLAYIANMKKVTHCPQSDELLN